METRANSGGDPLAVDGTTEHFLFPAGFGSAAVEFLKGPCIINIEKSKQLRKPIFSEKKHKKILAC